jgi:uncharacterized protein (TIGR03000 family)
MMRLQKFLVVPTTLLSIPFFFESQAQAQHRWCNNGYAIGIGVGFTFGPGSYGPYASPAIGAYPLWYPGFYGNGISMYGPPVPTYAPVPGTFGASDNSVIQNAPMLGISLAIPLDRPMPPPPLAKAVGDGAPLLLDQKMLDLRIDEKMMIVEAHLPIENASVFFNDQFVDGRGLVRLFSSPATLKAGQSYQYTVRAEWVIDGQKMSKTVKVTGTPWQRVIADLVK